MAFGLAGICALLACLDLLFFDFFPPFVLGISALVLASLGMLLSKISQ